MLLKVEGAPLPEPVKRKWTQEGSRPVNLLSHEDIDQKLSKAAQRRQVGVAKGVGLGRSGAISITKASGWSVWRPCMQRELVLPLLWQ